MNNRNDIGNEDNVLVISSGEGDGEGNEDDHDGQSNKGHVSGGKVDDIKKVMNETKEFEEGKKKDQDGRDKIQVPDEKQGEGDSLFYEDEEGGNNPQQTLFKPQPLHIPDDAFLIEAPSFIVPYLLEQNGEKAFKDLTGEDKIFKLRKPAVALEDYFGSPVGKMLTNIGMCLVEEFVQCDLLEMQKSQGETEKMMSKTWMMTHRTQKSILFLEKFTKDIKEINTPLKAKLKKCELCNFKTESELVMSTHDVTFHMGAVLERAPAFFQCPNCEFEDNSKAKLTRHFLGCLTRFNPAKNLDPPQDWDTPAKLQETPNNKMINPSLLNPILPKLNPGQHPRSQSIPTMQNSNAQILQQLVSGQLHGIRQLPILGRTNAGPSISITWMGQGLATPVQRGKTSVAICEICDVDINDLDQLKIHTQWIHKVKIHPTADFDKPPLTCQKCQFRLFTVQGLERHLLGSHGLITSSLQDAATKGQDSGRCPLCGKDCVSNLLVHVARVHNITLKPVSVSYKCRVCPATFGMYKLFISHVYDAHKRNLFPQQQLEQQQSKTKVKVTPESMPTNANQNHETERQN